MRFPGRLLDAHETPPATVLAFIADQVGVPASEFAAYRQRPANRREHIPELMKALGCRAFAERGPSSKRTESRIQGRTRLIRLAFSSGLRSRRSHTDRTLVGPAPAS